MAWTWRDNVIKPVVKQKGKCKKQSQHKFCPYWVARQKSKTGDVISYHCLLFDLNKPGISSLSICNSTYGRTYEGEP